MMRIRCIASPPPVPEPTAFGCTKVTSDVRALGYCTWSYAVESRHTFGLSAELERSIPLSHRYHTRSVGLPEAHVVGKTAFSVPGIQYRDDNQ
jgi:hypothetical protein